MKTPRSFPDPPLIVVMGASGCGKSTIGAELAARLGVSFVDADDLHPASNLEKMARGIPLTGEDRRPWLEEVGRVLARHEGTGTVIACSALRLIYRDIIRTGAPRTYFVHLDAPAEVLSSRLVIRSNHFMPVALLPDQMQTLEPLRVHENGVTLRADDKVDRIIRQALAAWRSRSEYV